MKTLITIALLLACSCTAAGQDHRAEPSMGEGSPVTLLVPEEYPTIQEAILAASGGDTVLVAPGTYFENINFMGKEIVVAGHYILHRDFELIQGTVIDGSLQQYADTASCVLFVTGEGSGAELVGFTLRGGTGTRWVDPQYPDWSWHSGGGILVFQASPTIRNNIITGNHVDDPLGADGASGGGICTFNGNPLIVNNIIRSNTALYGAGVVIDYSGCQFLNNIVADNSGGQQYGGGAFWTIGNGSDPIILENNTVVNNQVLAPGKGGALYLWSSEVVARNNIFWGNTQPEGGPVHLAGSATLDLTYSVMEGGYPGMGNLDADPLFADTSFLLSPGSPCIDSGDPDAGCHDPEDPGNPGYALWPSFGTVTSDMGVYGGPRCCYLGQTTVGAEELPDTCHPVDGVFDCFPNPFCDQLHIKMRLKEDQAITISLTDSNGRRVVLLGPAAWPAGEHLLSFGLAERRIVQVPGVYLCCFEGNSGRYCMKIVCRAH